MNYKIILQLFLPLELFMAISVIFKLYPPKKINNFYGYRTTRSQSRVSKLGILPSDIAQRK